MSRLTGQLALNRWTDDRPAEHVAPPPRRQLLPCSSAPPMATIHSLPTELLYRILELASPWPSSRNERPSESYTVLQSASLVSTSWRVAAQDRLWRRVYLSHVKVGKAFVWGSRNASHTTSELTIGIGPSMAPHLCQVVEACSGLKRVIFFNTSACWAVLCLPQMAGTLLSPIPSPS